MTEKTNIKHTICYLYSKANYPISIKYGKGTIIVPPYANGFRLADESKIGQLPKQIRMIVKEVK